MKRRVLASLIAFTLALGGSLAASGAHAADATTPSWVHAYGNLSSGEPGFVRAPDGHVWFVDRVKSTVDRIEYDGTITTHSHPGITYSASLAVGPDGGLWLGTYADWKMTAGILSRLDDVGDFVQVRTFNGGVSLLSGGHALWVLSGWQATRMSSDESSIDVAVPNTADMTQGFVGNNGSLWLRTTRGTLTPDFIRIGTDGSVETVGCPLPSGCDLGEMIVTSDSTAWFWNLEGEARLIRSDGTSTTVFSPFPADSTNRGIVGASTPTSNEVWFTRSVGDYARPTEVALVGKDGTRAVDVTLQSALAGWLTLWVDSSNRAWLSTRNSAANWETLVTSISPDGQTTQIAAGPDDAEFSSYAQASDGTIWATRGDHVETSRSVVHIDPATSTITTYPTPAGLMPHRLVLDAQDQEWVTYDRYMKQPDGFLVLQDTDWGPRPPTSAARVAGADRYATSVAVSQAAYPNGAPVVYIASGENYPDGLSASAAAGRLGAPVLLTPAGSVPSDVLEEIRRLKPGKIIIAGGVNAVSATAAAQLSSIQPDVVRDQGADRYATSRALAADVFRPAGSPSAYLATGQSFPDALAAAGAAGAAHAPVILVDGNASDLDLATQQLLRDLNVTSIHIVGGPNAVSGGVEEAASQIATTDRLGGVDRYGTAAVVAQSITGAGSWSKVFIASGQNYADAIPAGAWAASGGHPLVLAPFDGLTAQISSDIDARGTAAVAVVGGTAVLSWAVLGLQAEGTTLTTPW